MSNTQTIQTIEIDIDDSKLEAFTKFCARHDIDTDTITKSVFHGVSFECEDGEYYILTDMEAHEMCKDYIEETLWAFNASFLSAHMKADDDAIRALQNSGQCESLNPFLLSAIEDFDHFVNDAIMSDGRGHFLSSYDGEEHSETAYISKSSDGSTTGQDFYIYKIN